MLKNRIIPVLLTDGFSCVKPTSYDRPYRVLGPMQQYTRVMERRNIDEIVIIDIEASAGNRVINNYSSYVANLFCPISLGGGLKSVDDIGAILATGADKCIVGSGALNLEAGPGEPVISELIGDAARKFGAQAVSVAVDCFDDKVFVRYKGQPFIQTAFTIKDYAKALENEGAGEIILTDVMQEGRREGYNYYLIEKIANTVNIPVVANGGCGEPKHMALALSAGASAVAAGSLFLFTEHTPKTCARYLAENGYEVRI